MYTFELCVIFCTSELCVVERFSYGPRGGPTHFGGFVQVLQTVQVAVLGRILARPFGKFIKFTLNKIFEYVEMTNLKPPNGQFSDPKALWLFRASI